MAPRTKAAEIVEEAKEAFMEEPETESDGTFPELPPAYERGYNQVYGAFIAAQAEIGNIGRTTLNPHFKNKFVDLATATSTIIPILNKYGLGLQQIPDLVDGQQVIRTVIFHTDGSRLDASAYLVVSKDANDPQKHAASVTYARRNDIMAMVGAAPDDDDGNTAATPASPKVTQKDTLKKHLMSIKADGAKFKELATTAQVSAEKFADLTEADAAKIMKIVDSNVPF